MNALPILFMFAAIYVHQGIAKRIAASSPLMWGRERLTQPFYKGKVVGKEDDYTIVYFNAKEGGLENEFAIINDEDFSKKLVMDVNPYPYMIFVGSEVMTSFDNTCEASKCRYTAYVKSYHQHWGVGYSYRLSAWWDERQKAKQPSWVQKLMLPFTTSNLNLIRPIGRRRSSLCSYFNPGCRAEKDCILIDDLLPLIGCKGAKIPAPTSKPATLLPTTELTTIPTPTTTQEPPTLPQTLPRAKATPPPTQHPSTLPQTILPATVPPTLSPHSPTLPLTTDLSISTETSITDDPDLEEINKILEQNIDDTEKEFDSNSLWTILVPAAAVGCTVLVAVLVCVVKRRRSKATKSQDEESQVTRTERRKRRRQRDELGNVNHKTTDRRSRPHKDRDTSGVDTEDRRKKRRRRDQ